MAVTIASAKFSFVRFEQVNYFLPAYRQFDAAFQFLITGFYDKDSTLNLGVCDVMGTPIDAFADPVQAEILAYKFRIPTAISVMTSFFLFTIEAGEKLINYNKQITYNDLKKIMADDFGYNVIFDNSFVTKALKEIIITYAATSTAPQAQANLDSFWGRGYVRANSDLISPHFKTDQCFMYTISDDNGDVIGTSNQFKVIRDDTYTSLMYYQNIEDAFEFFYNGAEQNIVRLPFYLSRPQWPEKRQVYVKSNGNHKLTSDFIEKQYDLETDLIGADLHEFIKMALAHDEIIVESVTIPESPLKIVNADNYNPDWDEDPKITKAKGKTTVFAADFGYTNDNCEEVEYECPAPILTLGTIGLEAAQLIMNVPRGVSRILINYRKVGTITWSLVEIDADPLYALGGLDQATDYEVRVAGKCGEEYGSFGRTKSFKTFGVQACSPSNDLIFNFRDDQFLNFLINLPDPEPADIEVLMTRPDNTTQTFTISSAGSLANPFAFQINMGGTQQFGNYKFKVRSKCGPADYSTYSNEVIYSFQDVPQQTTVQYYFNIGFDTEGTFSVYVDNVSQFSFDGNKSGLINVKVNDQVRIFLRSRTGIVNIKVFEQNTATLIYDTTGNNNYQEDFSFLVDAGKSYYIDATITT